MEDRGIKARESDLRKRIAQHESGACIPVVRAPESDAPEPDGEKSPDWIAEAGVPVNGSIATRGSRKIVVDEARVRKYDLHTAYARRSEVKYFIVSLLLFCGAVWLFATGHWAWGLVPLPGIAFTVYMILLLRNMARLNPYESGMLVPAMVTYPLCVRLSCWQMSAVV